MEKKKKPDMGKRIQVVHKHKSGKVPQGYSSMNSVFGTEGISPSLRSIETKGKLIQSDSSTSSEESGDSDSDLTTVIVRDGEKRGFKPIQKRDTMYPLKKQADHYFIVSDTTKSTNTQSRHTTQDLGKATSLPTSQKSVQRTFLNTTFSVRDFLASRFQSLGRGVGLRTREGLYSLKSPESLGIKNLKWFSLKMLKDSYQRDFKSKQESIRQLVESARDQKKAIGKDSERLRSIVEESKTNPKEAGRKLSNLLSQDTYSRSFSMPYQNVVMWGRGKCLTARISESHRIGSVSLSSVLEGNVDPKYFLSEKAIKHLIQRDSSHIHVSEQTIGNDKMEHTSKKENQT